MNDWKVEIERMSILVVDLDDRILFVKCVFLVLWDASIMLYYFETGIKTGFQTAEFKQVETEPLVYVIFTTDAGNAFY